MGIYSRDYLRDDDPRTGGGAGGWRDFDAIKWIIILNVAVFVLQVVWHRPIAPELEEIGFAESVPVINDWFSLNRTAIFGGQVWRLLTYEFLHHDGTPWHLFFNMYFLYLAGRKVADFYGPREFLLFYLAAGVLSGIFSEFWFELFGLPGWSAIGASGAVAAVFVVYALHWPHDVFRLFGVIPVQVMWLALLGVVADVYPMLVEMRGPALGDSVAHSAHVGGMLFALFYQRRNWRIAPLADRVRVGDLKRALKPKAKLRVYEPETTVDAEARLDELLAKVAEHGEAGLTEAERAELISISRRYKNRQR